MLEHYLDNFYFDVSIHTQGIPYAKYIDGRHSLEQMANELVGSEYWDSLKNLAPDNLERVLINEEQELNNLHANLEKTINSRSAVLFGSGIAIINLLFAVYELCTSRSLFAQLILGGFAFLFFIFLPIFKELHKKVKIIRDTELKQQKATVAYLHQAKRTLETITAQT